MIGVLGISHNSAGLEVRELFSVSGKDFSRLGDILLQKTDILELVIISTCNRTEIYYFHQQQSGETISKQVLENLCSFNCVQKDYSQHFYSFSAHEAVNHLFSVVSGLKSMVFGEEQIVSQVKESYINCTNLSYTDAVLMRLFQKAFETGKKVRTETNIQKGATSVSYVAVDQCSKLITNWKDKKVLLIGTGETGRLVIQKLKKTGVSDFTFSNRTRENAEKLAIENNGAIIDFNEINNHLVHFDVIITATAAGKVILDKENIENSVLQRNGQMQVYIDLAVPRNIAPEIRNLENCHLLTVDSLNNHLEKNAEIRQLSKNDAEKIIEAMVEEYYAWYDNRTLKPVIKSITSNMQKIQKAELLKYKQNCAPEMCDAIDEYTNRLTQKYIRTLIKNLRELNENGEASASLDSINELFEFESEDK